MQNRYLGHPRSKLSSIALLIGKRAFGAGGLVTSMAEQLDFHPPLVLAIPLPLLFESLITDSAPGVGPGISLRGGIRKPLVVKDFRQDADKRKFQILRCDLRMRFQRGL